MYLRGDPYETSDAVFGVKESLVVDLANAEDVPGVVEKYGVSGKMKVMKYDFVLVSDDEVAALRNQKALTAAKHLGMKLRLEKGLLVRD